MTEPIKVHRLPMYSTLNWQHIRIWWYSLQLAWSLPSTQ